LVIHNVEKFQHNSKKTIIDIKFSINIEYARNVDFNNNTGIKEQYTVNFNLWAYGLCICSFLFIKVYLNPKISTYTTLTAIHPHVPEKSCKSFECTDMCVLNLGQTK
jgi:hypothetical protein